MSARLLRVGAALVAAVVLAGCGGERPELESLRPVPRESVPEESPSTPTESAPSADERLATATSALQDAARLSMSGTAIGSTDRIEFAYLFGADGDVEGRTDDQGVILEVRVVDGTYYLKGDEAFWAASLGSAADPQVVASTQRALAGRWVRTGPDDAASLRDLTRERLLAEYLPTSPVEDAAGREVDGRATVGLRGDGGTLYLDEETGRPVLVVLDDGSTARFDLAPPALEGAPAGAVALADLT